MIKFERVSIVAEKKEKQYVSDNAQLMAEWNWERNIEIAPSQLSFGSNRKVWWACTRGHEWQATVNNRSKGKGCPYCAGKKVLKGYNDLSTTNPEDTTKYGFSQWHLKFIKSRWYNFWYKKSMDKCCRYSN